MFQRQGKRRGSRVPAALAYWKHLEAQTKCAVPDTPNYVGTPARSRCSSTVSDGVIEIGPLLHKCSAVGSRSSAAYDKQAQSTEVPNDGGEHRPSYRTASLRNSAFSCNRLSRSVSNDILTNRSRGRDHWGIDPPRQRRNTAADVPVGASNGDAAVPGSLGANSYMEFGITESVVVSATHDSQAHNDQQTSRDNTSACVGSKEVPSLLLGADADGVMEGNSPGLSNSRNTSRISDVLANSARDSAYASDHVPSNGNDPAESTPAVATMTTIAATNTDSAYVSEAGYYENGSPAGSRYDRDRFYAETSVSTLPSTATLVEPSKTSSLPIFPSMPLWTHNQLNAKSMDNVDPQHFSSSAKRSLAVSLATNIALVPNMLITPKKIAAPQSRLPSRVESEVPFPESRFLRGKPRKRQISLNSSSKDPLPSSTVRTLSDQPSCSTIFPNTSSDFSTFMVDNLEVRPVQRSTPYMPAALPASVDAGIVETENWYRDEVEWMGYVYEWKKPCRHQRESFEWSCLRFFQLRRR
eukprot:GEMP01021318.1.p1 GENE.GEMP01021318.1~~GEMP01021318.1.p1  ORF type:complete len:525 (+),score=79.67 GEMP01021318.1:36-1610(+)